VFERREARVYAPLYRPQQSPIPSRRNVMIGLPGGGGSAGSAHSRPEPGAGDAPQSAGKLTGPVLVVDDDYAILISIRDILELEGYPVVTATNGTEALRRIEEERPALVLLDMRMPGLNGWDVARTLRERGIVVPILVMTAAQDARRWAEQIGADGYLAKPFDLDELLAAVERLLRG
jgi:CheY-like chemotaxis protein